MVQRRTLIRTAGGIATVGIIGSAGAKDANRSTSQSLPRKELRKRVLKAVREEGSDGVRQIYEKYGIEYEMTTITPENEKEDSGKSVQRRNSQSDSELTFVLNPGDNDDRVRASVIMTLKGYALGLQKAHVISDAIGISFDDDHWSVVGSPFINTTTRHHDVHFYSASLENGGLAGNVDIGTTGGGALPDDVNIVLEAQVENLDGVPGSLFGSYEHTHAYTSGSIESISGGLGAIDVELSSGSTAWDIAESLDPEPFLR